MFKCINFDYKYAPIYFNVFLSFQKEGNASTDLKHAAVISLQYFKAVASDCDIHTRYISLPEGCNRFQVNL